MMLPLVRGCYSFWLFVAIMVLSGGVLSSGKVDIDDFDLLSVQIVNQTTSSNQTVAILLSNSTHALALTCTTNASNVSYDKIRAAIAGQPAAYAVLFPFFTQIVGVIVFFLLKHYKIPIPVAAVMFILGAIMGFLAVQLHRKDQLTISILQWSTIDSNVLLLVFLPGLLFRDAIEVNFGLFRVAFWQLVILAFPMVLVGTALVTIFGMFSFPYDWPWSLAATLGAILSSTDPVAVAAVLKDASATPRMQMHIVGESMLNDGSAVVFFTLFSAIFLDDIGVGKPVTWSEGISIFFKMSLGGVAVGMAFAVALIFVLYILDEKLERQYDVLQVVAALSTAYISYYVADTVLGMSGVVSCVTTGIVASALGKGLVNDEELMITYLSLMEHMLNTLLFALGGVEWGSIIATHHSGGRDWGILLVLYVVITVIRFFQVALFWPVFSRIGLKSNWQEGVFLSFAGIRGAVGIALAVALYREVITIAYATNDEVALVESLVFLSGGVSLLTLSINGTAAGYILQILGLSKASAPRDRALQMFEAAAEDHVVDLYKKLSQEARFRNVRYEVVYKHVPFLPDDRPNVELSTRDFQRSMVSVQSGRHRRPQSLLRRTEMMPPQNVVVELRQVFLELLSEAYATLLDSGELDEKEDQGFNARVLKQSVAFAAAAVETEALKDWEYAQMFPYLADGPTFIRNRLRRRLSGEHVNAVEEQKMRVAVLRATNFIEAHRKAEKRLQIYLDATLPISEGPETRARLERALAAVLLESGTQVALAEKVLESVPVCVMESIMSHYMSSILIRALVHFVEKSAADALVNTNEAHEYLAHMDEFAENLRECAECFPNAHVLVAPNESALLDEGGHDCGLEQKSTMTVQENGDSDDPSSMLLNEKQP